MEFLDLITEFSYPNAILASYIVITLVKKYTKIKTTDYVLIAILTGVMIVILEEIVSNPITIQKVIAGALSGLISITSYEAINKIINKHKN